ncbi:hypothetical protein [Pseudomonas putida]|uniref:hypothetical protein n=1 Tax=Pseudomonas putida TaxID=303 RepID=UPI0037C8DECA
MHSKYSLGMKPNGRADAFPLRGLLVYVVGFVVVATLVVSTAGFLTVGTDLWDGGIVSRAMSAERPDVYHEWFNEAGLFLTPYIYDAVYALRNVVNHDALARFTTIIFLCLASLEVSLLAKKHFSTPKAVSLATALLFVFSPAWALYYSNIYLMHSITLFACLIATRWILERRILWAALPLLLASFQQSSNAPLAISLILLNSILSPTVHSKRLVDAGFIAFIVIGFFTLRQAFPTHGLYANYNKIEIESLLSLSNHLAYFTYFLILYAPILIAIVAFLILHPKNLRLFTFLAILVGIALNGAAYVAVDKLPLISEIGSLHGETLRFSFTSTVFASLLLPALWNFSSNFPRTRSFLILCIIFYTALLSIYAQSGKMKEVIFQRAFIAELRKLPAPADCIISIQSTGVETLRTYEYGDIFLRAYGPKKYVLMGPTRAPYAVAQKLHELFNKDTYRMKYLFPETIPKCVINMKITTQISTWSISKTLYVYFKKESDNVVSLSMTPPALQ